MNTHKYIIPVSRAMAIAVAGVCAVIFYAVIAL